MKNGSRHPAMSCGLLLGRFKLRHQGVVLPLRVIAGAGSRERDGIDTTSAVPAPMLLSRFKLRHQGVVLPLHVTEGAGSREREGIDTTSAVPAPNLPQGRLSSHITATHNLHLKNPEARSSA